MTNCKNCLHYGICDASLCVDSTKIKCKIFTPKTVYCKNCKHRYAYECPMHFQNSEWSDSCQEWMDCDEDNTEDDNFCKYGELRDEMDSE